MNIYSSKTLKLKNITECPVPSLAFLCIFMIDHLIPFVV